MFHPISGDSRRREWLAVLASCTALLAGCSSSMTPSESIAPVAQHAAVSGHIHGGNQPVAGATVTLYRASQSTFASGAVALASTTSAADGYGSFSFTTDNSSPNNNTTSSYSCLVSGTNENSSLFLVARGGTTTNVAGAAANPSAVFLAPLGQCNAVGSSTFISMSEVVTVATMAAIHQFMNPTTSPIESTVGSDGVFVSSEALTNAFATVSNLVNLSTGLAQAAFTKTGNDPNGGLGVVVTLTPTQAKLNQLANAVSSCINYSGSGNPACTTFYNNATAPANASATSVPGASYTTPPTDLLTALYYLFTNPTSSGSATTRGNIYGLSALAGAPYQPTLSATPNDWAMSIAYSSTSTCQDVTGSTAGFISSPASLSVDTFGDIWIGNNQTNAGSLGHLAASGLPASCTTLTPVSASSSMTGGARATTVDYSGNIYAGLQRSNDIYRFTPSSSASTPVDIPTLGAVAALASDGSGDLFYATTAGNLYEVTTARTGTSFTTASSTLINTSTLGSPTRLMIDGEGRIWATSGGSYLTYTQSTSGTYATTTVTLGSALSGVTIGAQNSSVAEVFATSPSSSAVANLSITSANVATTGTAFSGGGNSGLIDVALDGSGNTWGVGTGTTYVAGYDASGNSLASTTGLLKGSADANGSNAIVVDPGGNIWVAGTSNTISEFVGAAVPVYQSYAAALNTSRFQTIP